MPVYTINPLDDPRWSEFTSKHVNASVAHSAGWLNALKQTYGYQPIVYTTTPPRVRLGNGVVLCRVRSWLTGSRLVSLPFTDHCEPLVDREDDVLAIVSALQETAAADNLKYVELRAPHSQHLHGPAWEPSSSFRWHVLDLSPPLETLFRNAHKTAIQQAVRRAEREHLVYEAGRSEDLLNTFYGLLLLTRRRHKSRLSLFNGSAT